MTEAQLQNKHTKQAVWRSQNQEKIKAYRETRRELDKWAAVQRNYGITREQFFALLEAQNNRCPLCETNDPGYAWCVDHDHDTGLVRGILCHWCNRLLGMMGDTLDGVGVKARKMLRYLGDK